MRPLRLKYGGECRKCSAILPVGAEAIYERRAGIWCPGCAPTDPDEIRAVRQEAADRKADRLEEWAEKRERKASAVLTSHPQVRHDWAFITQPGHIPLRARMNAADGRAMESLQVAGGFRGRAASLRSGVRIAGDAERRREANRAKAREWVTVGMVYRDPFYGSSRVTRINKNTVSAVRLSDGVKLKTDLSWVERFQEPTQ